MKPYTDKVLYISIFSIGQYEMKCLIKVVNNNHQNIHKYFPKAQDNNALRHYFNMSIFF